MLPKAKEVDLDFEALGQRMLDRKKQLLKAGIPLDAEHAMVARAHGRGDSSAKAAKKRKPARTPKASGKVSAARKRGAPVRTKVARKRS